MCMYVVTHFLLLLDLESLGAYIEKSSKGRYFNLIVYGDTDLQTPLEFCVIYLKVMHYIQKAVSNPYGIYPIVKI